MTSILERLTGLSAGATILRLVWIALQLIAVTAFIDKSVSQFIYAGF